MKREAEEKVYAALEAIPGMILSRPGEGHPQSDVFDQWGVCVGSHGGYGKTLPAAMRRCLKCCGLGAWWKVNYGEGELMADVFDRISKEHFGKPLSEAR